MSGYPYVALGDSYAAGIGSATPGDRCRRVGGYPTLVARRLGLDLAYQASHGALITDVFADQLDALGGQTQLVTLTVGGNDAGFAEVVLACAKPSWLADGLGTVLRARRRTERTLARDLVRLLREIRRRAPDATVVLTGYPQLFGPADCRWYTFFSPVELAALRQGTDSLVDLLMDVATRERAVPVDVRADFAGHHVCSDEPWIHHVTLPFESSFHPTAHGHIVYAHAVIAALPAFDVSAALPADVGQEPATGIAPVMASDIRPGPRRPGSAPRIDVPTLVRAGGPPRLRRGPAASRVDP